MRLTKIQRRLKELNVDFTYEEKAIGFGELYFYSEKSNGMRNLISVSETSGNNGKTPTGIFFSFYGHDYFNQMDICDWLDRNHDTLIRKEEKMKRFPEHIIDLVKERFPEIRVYDGRNSLVYSYQGDKIRAYLDEFCETIYTMSAITHTTEIEEFPKQADKLLKFHEFSVCLDTLVENYIIAGGKMV